MDLLEDNTPIGLDKLLTLDFKKFVKLKKGLTNKELRKLLPKRYHNFINMCLQKGVDILPPHRLNNYAINIK